MANAKKDTSSKSAKDDAAPYDEPIIIKKLSSFLADSYFTYLKTQGYHWNVRGPNFYSLHNLFEEQYTNFFAAIDVIAERIRALGADAPGSFEQFRKISDIKEATGVPTAEEMIADLVKDHEQLSKRSRELIAAMEKVNDMATADLMTERLGFHDQAAWMLRSSLG